MFNKFMQSDAVLYCVVAFGLAVVILKEVF